MEDKLEMMSELVGDGCNTVNPATYCDISNVGADKVTYFVTYRVTTAPLASSMDIFGD